MSIKQLAQSMCGGPDGRPRCAGSQIKPVTGAVWAAELKLFSQGGIEGEFGQGGGPLTASEMCGGGGLRGRKRRPSVPCKGGDHADGTQDHAWGEATGWPKWKEAKFP